MTKIVFLIEQSDDGESSEDSPKLPAIITDNGTMIAIDLALPGEDVTTDPLKLMGPRVAIEREEGRWRVYVHQAQNRDDQMATISLWDNGGVEFLE